MISLRFTLIIMYFVAIIGYSLTYVDKTTVKAIKNYERNMELLGGMND